jgi:hypothetical protein
LILKYQLFSILKRILPNSFYEFALPCIILLPKPDKDNEKKKTGAGA